MDLFGDHSPQGVQLSSRSAVTDRAEDSERGKSVAILCEVLPPTYAVDVLEQYLHFPTNQQCLECRVIDINVIDRRLLYESSWASILESKASTSASWRWMVKAKEATELSIRFRMLPEADGSGFLRGRPAGKNFGHPE